ncbi:hypothetical protein QA641_36130 [Bradyrhizobium sp. CB1650]|uniref:hypothetical protein n=1 Tax=Bradyrhizobium sp. CB1650 TaxID=3039153 RepID=UPI00243556E5|nr:hypothetical protein [Bradyrhizobium sp. CB1650]WGD50955.1 hypothetical protein QA641_36130 [Bradyrhizobium sp. CB1650]
MARLDRQTLHLINYQFRQVVRDEGYVPSVANERRARQGFGCKTSFAALTATSNCSPMSAKAGWLIPPVSGAFTLDVVLWLPSAQIQRPFGQARQLSRVSLTTIPMKRFVKPSLLRGEPCFLVAAIWSRKPPSMQMRGTARLA